MKKLENSLPYITIWFISTMLLSSLIISCSKKGETSQKLYGNEAGLPAELKGLKVYNINTNNTGGVVKVAILPNNEVNSLTYAVGKTIQTTVIINQNSYNERTIVAKEILVENDSIIVIRK